MAQKELIAQDWIHKEADHQAGITTVEITSQSIGAFSTFKDTGQRTTTWDNHRTG